MSDELASKVQQYFKTIFDVLEKYPVHPVLYVNADETFNDATDEKSLKVICHRDKKDTFTKSAGKIVHTTLMGGGM